jgi:formylglycine-generating enzyme required for sulfatase activity
VQDACRNQLSTKGLGVGEEHQAGVITFASCSPAERSYEIEALQQGSFTYALLESLRLQGEGNCATVERLYQRLRYRVAEINQKYNKPRQTPYAIVEPATKYHLILLPNHATLRDIDALKLDAQDAELERDLQLAEQLWTRILAVSPADPQALRALRRIWNQPQEKLSQPQPTSPLEASSKSAELTPGELKHSNLPPLQAFEFEVVTVNAKGREVTREKTQAQYLTERLGKDVTLEMVYIPAGSFMMGSPENELERTSTESPQHRVNIPAFFIGKYQVTQAQWKAVAALTKVKIDLDSDPSSFKGDRLPVESVSWLDTLEFCRRLSKETGKDYRLPSEAEWEYACRAGTITPFHFGEMITPELVNYNGEYPYADAPKGEYRKKTTPVGRFPANAFGLYDMHGNLWEWCADDWHDNYERASTDGSIWIEDIKNYEAPETGKLLRGGSWYNLALNCRSACRFHFVARLRAFDIGFRVVAFLR